MVKDAAGAEVEVTPDAVAEAPVAPAAPAPKRMLLIPLISRAVAGMNVAWPIFGDTHPARVLAEPEYGADDFGRQGTIIRILVQRTRLNGESFTKIQKVLEQFVFQRPDGLTGAMIDGPDLAKAVLEHSERFSDYLATQQATASVYADAAAGDDLPI